MYEGSSSKDLLAVKENLERVTGFSSILHFSDVYRTSLLLYLHSPAEEYYFPPKFSTSFLWL